MQARYSISGRRSAGSNSARHQGSTRRSLQGSASLTSLREKRAWARRSLTDSRYRFRTSPSGRAIPCATPPSKLVCVQPSSFPCLGPQVHSARWSCSGAGRANFPRPSSVSCRPSPTVAGLICLWRANLLLVGLLSSARRVSRLRALRARHFPGTRHDQQAQQAQASSSLDHPFCSVAQFRS